MYFAKLYNTFFVAFTISRLRSVLYENMKTYSGLYFLKGWLTQKKKILSLITHPYDVPKA